MQFPPKPEGIFQYFDGEKEVFADPEPIWRNIYRLTGGQPNAWSNAVYAATPETTDPNVIATAIDAEEKLEALVRHVFQMKPIDPKTGQGASWPLCLGVWRDYCLFMDDLKKKRETWQPPSASSDGPQATLPAMASGSA